MLTVRASEIGGCPRLLWHKLRGDELESASGRQMEVFAKGNAAEAGILEWACEGLEVVEQQHEVEFQLGPMMVTGHLDALCRAPNTGALVVVEAKLMGKDRFARAMKGEWPQQILDQVACYMHGTGATEGHLAAQEFSGEGRAQVWLHKRERPSLTTLTAMLQLLQMALEENNLTLAPQEPGEFGCSACSARFHCYPRWRPWYAVGEEGEQVGKLIHSYAVLQDARKKIEASIKELQEKLAGIMEPHETDVLKTAESTVRWVETTRETLDQKAIPEDLKAQLTPYYKKSKSRSLRVYRKGDDDDERT